MRHTLLGKAFWLAALSTFMVMANPRTVNAQLPQGMFEQSLVSSARGCADALKSYFKENKHFPQSVQDEDAALNYVWRHAFGTSPDVGVNITSDGAFRVLGNLRISIDETIRNAPLDQWKQNPPGNWSAPANSIVMICDGQSQYLIWCAAINGVPIRDSNQQCIFLVGNLDPQPANP